jgi:hypothetical protein
LRAFPWLGAAIAPGVIGSALNEQIRLPQIGDAEVVRARERHHVRRRYIGDDHRAARGIVAGDDAANGSNARHREPSKQIGCMYDRAPFKEQSKSSMSVIQIFLKAKSGTPP